MAYEVRIQRPAHRYLQRCDRPTQKRLVDRIDALSEDPYEYSKLLENAQGKRSSRVGDLRIIFEVDEPAKTIHIHTIAPRGQAYRRL